MTKNNEQFYLAILDHDNMEFNVIGPMIDDTLETNQVVEEQKKGRKLTCSSANDLDGTVEHFKKEGYTYAPDKKII